MADYTKPLPEITAESRPFWEGCRRHQLLVQRCRACGARQHYPRGVCASCWSDDLEWLPSAGRGTVYSFTVTHRTQARGFKDELPYMLAWVELEEGVQVLTNLVGCDPATVAIGMSVQVTFEDVTPEISIPRFAPAGAPLGKAPGRPSPLTTAGRSPYKQATSSAEPKGGTDP